LKLLLQLKIKTLYIEKTMKADAILVPLIFLTFHTVGNEVTKAGHDSQEFCDKESCADSMFEYEIDKRQMAFRKMKVISCANEL